MTKNFDIKISFIIMAVLIALVGIFQSWGVALSEKVDGKYKVRTNPALADDIQASVCKAVLEWESREEPSQSSSSRVD